MPISCFVAQIQSDLLLPLASGKGQIDPTDSLDCSSNAVNAEVLLNPEKMDGVRKIQIGEKGEHPDTIRKVLDDML
ncbi:hypothetical protein U1Q18_039669 [Sarracenia purpurea var. burkii]